MSDDSHVDLDLIVFRCPFKFRLRSKSDSYWHRRLMDRTGDVQPG